MMNSQMPATVAESNSPSRSGKADRATKIRGQLYLSFMLDSEMFGVDIKRIREIIEYTQPTIVPMMPDTLRGVINVRGSVVPVVDLAVRFGWPPVAAGRRTSIVIVEIMHNNQKHALGLVVDRVNAVTEIANEDVEAAPPFGVKVNADFISGMAKCDGRFLILLNVERTLSVDEMAAVAQAGSITDSP